MAALVYFGNIATFATLIVHSRGVLLLPSRLCCFIHIHNSDLPHRCTVSSRWATDMVVPMSAGAATALAGAPSPVQNAQGSIALAVSRHVSDAVVRELALSNCFSQKLRLILSSHHFAA